MDRDDHQDDDLRAWLDAFKVAGWQERSLLPFIEQHDRDVRAVAEGAGARITWWVTDETHEHPTRAIGFEGIEYDHESWIDPALWDAAVDDGARVLRCGHCGASTDFNVRDHLDVLCEGCGTTYMARPTDPE